MGFNGLLKNLFLFMIEYLCVCPVCVDSHEGHERVLHSLELEFQVMWMLELM